MANLKKILRDIDRARLRAQKQVGIPTTSRELARRIVGRRNLPAFGFKRAPMKPTGAGTVKPAPEVGLPGAHGRPEKCLAIDPLDGASRRPYTLIGSVQLAADAAQAINTNLADYLDAASVDDITTDNVVPFGVSTTGAQLLIGSNDLSSAPVFNLSMAGRTYIRWLVNGIEEARWPTLKFNPLYERGFASLNGAANGAAAAAAVAQMHYDPVPFVLFFDPDKTYEANLYTTRAFTPQEAVDTTMVWDGMR